MTLAAALCVMVGVQRLPRGSEKEFRPFLGGNWREGIPTSVGHLLCAEDFVYVVQILILTVLGVGLGSHLHMRKPGLAEAK